MAHSSQTMAAHACFPVSCLGIGVIYQLTKRPVYEATTLLMVANPQSVAANSNDVPDERSVGTTKTDPLNHKSSF